MARLLLTNCTDNTAGGVYLVDTAIRKVSHLFDQSCRGVTRGPDAYHVVTNDGRVYAVDVERGKTTLRAETGLKGCHDIRWKDGEYYIVASKGNQVVRFDPEFRQVDRLQIVEDEGDVCHANCLQEWRGDLLLTILTLSPLRREQKRYTSVWQTQGKVLRLNWETKSFDILVDGLRQPHTPIQLPSGFFCCESRGSCITRLDLEKGTNEVVKTLHNFVRGLAVADGSLWVGISKPRRPMGTRWQRLLWKFKMSNGLLELDPETLQVRSQIPVPGAQVYEFLVYEPF